MQRLITISLISFATLQVMAQKEIKTSIHIQAPPSVVWEILSDFQEYENWNPFLTSVEGEFIVGDKVKITADGMKFRPKVLAFDSEREIRWKGKLLFKGIFDGEHIFKITDNEDGTCTFEQNEQFSGILVGMMSKKLDTETKQGFEEMNQKLKELAEAKNATTLLRYYAKRLNQS